MTDFLNQGSPAKNDLSGTIKEHTERLANLRIEDHLSVFNEIRKFTQERTGKTSEEYSIKAKELRDYYDTYLKP